MIELAFLSALLAGVEAAPTARMDAWEFRQAITISGDAGLARLELAADTLDASRADLADLRLLSGEREIPYTLQREEQRAESVVALASPQIRAVNNKTTIEAEIPEATTAPLLDAVFLDVVEPDFLKSATVLGSSDGRTWMALTAFQPLFRRAGGASRLSIEFNPQRLRRIRIELDDRRAPPVAVTGLRVRTTAGEAVATETLRATILERSEKDSQSRLVLRLPHRNPFVADLTVATTDALFTRRVSLQRRVYGDGQVEEQPVADGTIFRIAAGVASEDLRLAIGRVLAGPEVTLVIENQDSPPLAIEYVDLAVVPTTILFTAPPGGTLELYTGNPEAVAPRYDLAALAPRLDAAAMARATTASASRNPTYAAPALRLALDALGAVIDTSDYRARARVELSEGGIYRLELDPKALAGSDPSGGDLRLVRDGHQIPYVADRTGYARELPAGLSALPPGENAQESRYEIVLPLPRLPITALAFTVDDALLDRTVTLLEERKDDRGQRRDVVLGSGSWTRRPGDPKRALTVALRQRPESTRLELRVANADNPALSVQGVFARYTTSKLIFAARATGETWLYYGNPRATTPRYDLALMAERLLTSTYRDAKLSATETLAPAPVAPGEMTPSRKLLFWGALALSVVILLAVVVKLLPRAGESA